MPSSTTHGLVSAEGQAEPPPCFPLSHRQKTPYLSALTLGLLHRFNNLFTGVMFLTEDCLAAENFGDQERSQLEEVRKTLREAHSIVEEVVALHSDEQGEEASYEDLDAIISSLLHLAKLLLPRGATLNYVAPEERLAFYASRQVFQEILLHLLGNAGDALPRRGGEVTLATSNATGPNGHPAIRVEITDNGPGFTDVILSQLFRAACTTKVEGNHIGVGLLHCRELARSYGGELTATNRPEGGAVVTLTLPRDNPKSIE